MKTYADEIRARNPRFTLTIDMGNAAFADDPHQLATLLDKMGIAVLDQFEPQERTLLDTNGNSCGRMVIEDDDVLRIRDEAPLGR